MQLVAFGNRWECNGIAKTKLEKRVKKYNKTTLKRQHFIRSAKGLLELGLISQRDYDEIKRTVFRGEEK